jgi:hypothetical protein
MFPYASEICIRKAQSFQRSDFDAEILSFARHSKKAPFIDGHGAQRVPFPKALMRFLRRHVPYYGIDSNGSL